jgi:protein TonB
MGEQGTVHFLLTVDETGAPLTCEVTGSSGSAELDNATCKLVQRRAKFTPAADKSGAPTVGYYFNSARWFIPEAKVAPDASELTVSYVVNADGVPGACTVVTQAGEAAAKWARKLSLCPTVAYDQPYRGAQGQPIAQKVTVTLKINVADGQ